jgi:hypothetical protein
VQSSLVILSRNASYHSGNSGSEPYSSKEYGKERPNPDLSVEPIPQNATEQHADDREERQLKRKRYLL